MVPELEVVVDALPTGFATSSPEPEHKARDKVLAYHAPHTCFAEAVDLTTMDGKSLRLELDSENATRFTKWWRDTPANMELRIAYRRAGSADIATIAATCHGRIAPRPAGPAELGWDRLFIPDAFDLTLAELAVAGDMVQFRRVAYGQMAAALAGADQGLPPRS